MSDCVETQTPQGRRVNQKRQQLRRRADDKRHLEWCARTLGGIIVFTAVLSVAASTTISAMMANFLAESTDARVDAIRFDVNVMQRQIKRIHQLEAAE